MNFYLNQYVINIIGLCFDMVGASLLSIGIIGIENIIKTREWLINNYGKHYEHITKNKLIYCLVAFLGLIISYLIIKFMLMAKLESYNNLMALVLIFFGCLLIVGIAVIYITLLLLHRYSVDILNFIEKGYRNSTIGIYGFFSYLGDSCYR